MPYDRNRSPVGWYVASYLLRFVELDAVGVALALLVFPGCVSVEHYPSSWGDKPTGGQCASVTGAYENKGLGPDGAAAAPLAFWLNPTVKSNSPERFQLAKDLSQAQTVKITLEGTLLSINASSADAHREWSFDSSKGQFECRDGVIRIKRWHVDGDIVLLAEVKPDLVRPGA